MMDVTKKVQEKIELLKTVDSYNSRFIQKVLKAFIKENLIYEEKKNKTEIIINDMNTKNTEYVIHLDNIWAKPYFYTRMRIHLENIVNLVIHTDNQEILKHPKKFCNKVVFHHKTVKMYKKEDEIDIVDFIGTLKNKSKEELNRYLYCAKKLDKETLFKEEQIKQAIRIIQMQDKQQQYSAIYDELYQYLTENFISNQYCDFRNNQCIAQRRMRFYPVSHKDGCCFMQIRKCHYLHNGECSVKCLPCRLFACRELGKRGVGYWGNDFILLKAFLNNKQMKHFIFDFYKDKDEILKNMDK